MSECARCILVDELAVEQMLRVKELKLKLSELAESGTGYSQQAMDAMCKERDLLKKQVEVLCEWGERRGCIPVSCNGCRNTGPANSTRECWMNESLRVATEGPT